MNQYPTHDGRAVANFILEQADRSQIAVSNMALNKLVYFAHVWFLVGFGRPLIIQNFEAWQHGPLVQDVYQAFRHFGDKPITSRATKLDRTTAQRIVCKDDFPRNELALLLPVINYYMPIPASRLRNMTHIAGGPWEKIWNHEGTSNPGMIIPNDAICDFYNGKLPPIGAVNAYS